MNVLHKGSKSFNINSYEHKEQVTFVDGCELVNNRMMVNVMGKLHRKSLNLIEMY